MAIAAFTFFALVVGAIGYCVACLVFGKSQMTRCELLGWSLLAGTGTLSFALFVISCLSIAPSRRVLVVLIIASLLATLMLRRRRRVVSLAPLAQAKVDRWTFLIILPLIAIVFCVVAASVNALQYPLYEWDAFSIWFFKAKLLFAEPLFPRPEYFQNAAMSYSHRDYPLLQPMFVAGSFAAMGEANDRFGRLALLLPYVGMAFLFYADARRRTSSSAALWLAAVFVCAPAIPFWAPSGNADVVLAALYTAHLVYLARWLESRDRSSLVAAGLFGCFTWFTKHEGEVLALISAAIVLVVPAIRSRRFDRRVLLFPAMLAVILLPWHLFSWNLPHSAARFPEHLTPSVLAQNLPSLWPTLRLISGEMLHWQSWGFLFPLLLICALLTPKRIARSDALILWLIFLAQLGLYTAIGTLSLPDMKRAYPLTLPWFFVQMVPVVAMLIVAHWPGSTGDRSPPQPS
jgi:hypothetical protein